MSDWMLFVLGAAFGLCCGVVLVALLTTSKRAEE